MDPHSNVKAVRIGVLAEATGTSRDALRFYESKGLIRATRSPNGYREYPDQAVELVRYVRTAQHLGFSLAEISNNVASVAEADDQAAALVALMRSKGAFIENRIDELNALGDELRARIALECPLITE